VSVYVPPESLLESKAFRRLLAFSLAGHVLLFAALTFRPRSRAEVFTANPVMVNVVAAPPAARPTAPKPVAKPAPKPPPPKPEVKPEPPPPPPPPKPVVNEVVIPKEPAPLAKPKPKPAPAKPETPPKSAEQLLSELTQKVEAEHPDSVPEQAPPAPELPEGPPTGVAGGPGTFDPAMAAWQGRVKALIHSNWSGAQICKGTPVFDLDIDASGGLEDLSLATSSGDRYCDESAERAVRKSIPLPASPRGAISIELVLNPKAAQ